MESEEGNSANIFPKFICMPKVIQFTPRQRISANRIGRICVVWEPHWDSYGAFTHYEFILTVEYQNSEALQIVKGDPAFRYYRSISGQPNPLPPSPAANLRQTHVLPEFIEE